eukprot:CAMPEP_0184292728 /NCGR_PEP_ID=MMETSP1049-20130417/4438_1 /TAXON_ID=77928 /ORGANISM="Proteomonas sulcata, Strain CCMP704" /LENGTH=50 /DNA_ID=CAMNT_0026600601 /DNA_START=13 /DNA_END=162 /DNA_ORIENTATION=+
MPSEPDTRICPHKQGKETICTLWFGLTPACQLQWNLRWLEVTSCLNNNAH